MSVSGPGEPLEPTTPIALPEGEAGFSVEEVSDHVDELAVAEDESFEAEEVIEEPKPLPLHIQNSLVVLLGDKAEDYVRADDGDKIAILVDKIGGSTEVRAESDEPTIDQFAIKASLDLITARSQHELSRELELMSVERATDLLERLNSVSTTARRLGANRLRGFLGLGLGTAAGVLTSVAIRAGERAAGYAGGMTGALLGAIGYQALYQRTVESSWQRVSNPAAAYVGAVLLSPFKTTEEAMDRARAEHTAEPKNLVGRLWQSLKIRNSAFRSSLKDSLREIHDRSRLKDSNINDLDRDELLSRFAAARLALTRQERRVASTSAVNPNHERQLGLYSLLVRRAVTEFTHDEIKAAMDAVRRNARGHLVGSLLFGAAGGLAGALGARALAHDSGLNSGEPTPSVKPVLPASGAPDSPLPAPAPMPIPAPTPVHQLSGSDLSHFGHFGRAKALEAAGAGHFENGHFVITAEWGVDAHGQYIMAGGQRLAVNNGVTDIRPLKVEMREYADFRSAEIQRAVTGENLVHAYNADSSTVAQATKIKDALAKHLVEQQIYGHSTLSADVHQKLEAVGYDFDFRDVSSTNDVRAEIHQAMSKWFAAQPKSSPLTGWKPALPRPTDLTRPSYMPIESTHTAPAPSIERYLYDSPKAAVSEPQAALPELATAPRLDLSIKDQPQLHEYQGWHWPAVEVETPSKTIEPPIKVEMIHESKISSPPVAPAEPVLARPDLGSTPTVAVGPGAPQHPSFEARVDKKAVLDDFFPDGGPQISPAEIEEAIQVGRSTLTD